MPHAAAIAPVLYLPIEHVQRELDGKLLLAIEAVRRGYTVVVGEHERLNRRIALLPAGAYLYKDCASWQAAKLFPRLQQAGHKVLALDEEGLIFRSEEAYLRDRVDSTAVRHLDLLFAWGDVQKQVLLKKNEVRPESIRVVGNPRLDLCRLTPATHHSRPPFRLLVNTRFTIVNSIKSTAQTLDALRRLGVIRNPQDEDFYAAFVARDTILIKAFVDAVRQLAQQGNRIDIIVRPHPGEATSYYASAFAGLDNVRVDNRTSLTEQLSWADLVLHEGCTTAIEAALMGIPSVALSPTPPLSEPLGVPNSFSECYTLASDAVARINELVRTNTSFSPSLDASAMRALENAQGAYAFERICDELATVTPPTARTRTLTQQLSRGARLQDIRLSLKALFYLRLLPRLRGPAAPMSKRAASFANKQAKFPLMAASRIRARVEAIAALHPAATSLDIKRIDSQTFVLTRGQA